MKEMKILFLGVMSVLANAVFAIEVPQVVADSFAQVCPQVADASWSADEGYYVATFTQDDFETKLWFTDKGDWVMEQVDWQTMSEAPSAVFNAFSAGQYSGNEVVDVVQIVYPEQGALVALLVGMPNEEGGCMLLYNEHGELIDSSQLSSFTGCLGACNLLQSATAQ